jgi:hypothetical protein
LKSRVANTVSLAFCLAIVVLTASLVDAQSLSGESSSSQSSSTISLPRLVQFSGTVGNDQGEPRPGTVGITFSLYKDEQGGAPLWMETQNVTLDSTGHYTVQLGATEPDGLPIDVFASGEARWLGVQPEKQSEQPRVLLMAVPYALKAADAATIGGLPPSAFMRAQPQSGASSDGNEPALNTAPQVVSASTLKDVQTSGGKATFFPLWTNATTIGNSLLSQAGSDVTLAGNLFLQKGNLNVGEGQLLGQTGFFQSNNGTQVFQATQTGSTGNGVEGISEANNGVGVFGSGVTGVSGFGLSNGTGVSGQGGIGVFGNAPATTGPTTGVLGKISTSSENSAAVEGVAEGNGLTFAVAGLNFSGTDFSAGVAGFGGGFGTVFGVEGSTSSRNGVGVYGTGDSSSLTGQHFLGCCAFGVWGDTGLSFATDLGAAGLIGTADDARAIFLQNDSPSGVPTAFMQQSAAGKFALMAGGGNNTNSCTIDTNGSLFCPGGTSVVASVDSGLRQVALYGVQSPQSWFEDFGSGQLANGQTRVSLEPAFAQTVNTSSDYHVFLTPKGDCRGLYVSKTTPTGFEVRELGGGQSSVAFDYRIVALRRGFESVRMEDMTKRMAEATVPMPKGRSVGRQIPRPIVPAAGLATSSATLATTPSTR